MKWNPIVNGIGAAAYVFALALLVSHISSLQHDTPDNLIGTVAAMSLFTFSAAVMAFLFFYRPVALLIESRKGEALSFFLKTLAAFGAIGLLVILTIV